ncbi:hypothetical protein ACGF0J_29235 [Nonomuraea sp. NPDC047897]|uniref:hypothetical protein n=1 Tax=Nonomuraea sp. NPDC047897 TaxID=3364346 RepID=UPI00372180CE
MNEELARLLPPPAERDLPEGRHRQLKEFVMTEIQPRHRRLPRPALLLPAAGLAAALVVGAPLVLGGGAPAYAIDRNPDGTITVTINQAKNPEALQEDLRAMGVNTVVDYIPPGKRCDPQPRSQSWADEGTVLGKLFVRKDTAPPEGVGFSIDPAAVKEGQTAVLEFGVREGADMTVAGMWSGVSNGPVAACTLVDDPDGGLGPSGQPTGVLMRGEGDG